MLFSTRRTFFCGLGVLPPGELFFMGRQHGVKLSWDHFVWVQPKNRGWDMDGKPERYNPRWVVRWIPTDPLPSSLRYKYAWMRRITGFGLGILFGIALARY